MTRVLPDNDCDGNADEGSARVTFAFLRAGHVSAAPIAIGMPDQSYPYSPGTCPIGASL